MKKGEFWKKTTRQDRYPKDMAQELHEYIDNFFQKKFRHKARSSSAFCQGDTDVADDYGQPWMVFPIGAYEVIWSPVVKDLFTEFENQSIGNIEPDVYFEERTRDDYEEEFGEESHENGEWIWNEFEVRGKWKEHKGDVAWKMGKDYVKRYGWDDYDDHDEAVESYKDLAEDEMKWVPAMEWADFWQERLDQWVDDKTDTIDTALSTYKKGNVLDAINSGHEIMLMTKSYWVLDRKWEPDIQRYWKSLTSPGVHPNQLNLPFKKR